MIAELYKASIRKDDKSLFSDLSFLVSSGDRMALVGGDATTATLILRSLLGMTKLDTGWASYDGEPILPSIAPCFRRDVAYMPKKFGFGSMTIERVAKDIYSEKINKDYKYNAVDVQRSLKQLGVDEKCIGERFDALDKATAQRVAMALAFMFERPVALLDSPTSEQDELGRNIVANFIASQRFDNVAVIVATNDPEIIAVCNKRISL